MVCISLISFRKQTNESYADDDGSCVWYGVCKNMTGTSHKLYCSYNGTAKQLDSNGQRLLSQYCPQLLSDAANTFTCCDAEQVIYEI